MNRQTMTMLLVLAVALGAAAQDTIAPLPAPRVQLALLLDTSNSMDGLINQAKSELWAVVNTFVTAKRDGRDPVFEVALYQYGNNGLDLETGHVQQVLPLTTDLDAVSEKLFALTTNGGQEYCGMVIRRAAQDLSWSGSPDDLKAVFIAGNEPFTQGAVDYREACKEAVARGVVVNTIHCGPNEEGVQGMWADGAKLADGSYTNIDHDQVAEHIPAPQDDEIIRLTGLLNATYVPYGALGSEKLANQSVQDTNALSMGVSALIGRGVTKSSKVYNNASWDLVDAVKQEEVRIDDLVEGDLPEELRGMTSNMRKAYLEGKAAERADLQAQLQKLNEERKEYVANQRKEEAAAPGAESLGSALQKIVRRQAGERSFTFE